MFLGNMGSLDFRGAKRQFLMLIDNISSSHIPTFAIWLDTKIAEYKVNGMIREGSEDMEKRPYPEWISKSLRQNLSFILPEDSPSKQRKLDTGHAPRTAVSGAAGGNLPAPRAAHAAQTRDTGQRRDPGEDFVVKVELNTEADMSDEDYHTGAFEHPLPESDNSTFSSHQPSDVLNLGTSQSNSSLLGGFKPERESLFSSPSSMVESSSSHQVSSSGAPLASAAAISRAAPLAGSFAPSCIEGTAKIAYTQRAVKILTCPKCPKTFTRMRDQMRHTSSHSSIKPFVCPHCGKGFSRMYICYNHQRTVHPDKPLRTFNEAEVLAKHCS